MGRRKHGGQSRVANIPGLPGKSSLLLNQPKLPGEVAKAKTAAEQAVAIMQKPVVDGWKDPTRLMSYWAPAKGSARKTLRKSFDRCVKAVRKTVKARKGSNKESAAIAICTKTILHPRGRTLKRYTKGRLLTQKKFRGGNQCS